MLKPEVIVRFRIGVIFSNGIFIFPYNLFVVVCQSAYTAKLVDFKAPFSAGNRAELLCSVWKRLHFFGDKRSKNSFSLSLMRGIKEGYSRCYIIPLLSPAFFYCFIRSLFIRAVLSADDCKHILRKITERMSDGNLILFPCLLKVCLKVIFIICKIHFIVHTAGMLAYAEKCIRKSDIFFAVFFHTAVSKPFTL